MCATPAPNCYLGSVTVWNAVRGAHFHHQCAPLLHRIATLDPRRCGTLCAVLIFIINVRHSRTKLLLCIRDGVERCARYSFLSYMCATPAPNCYFVSPSEHYGAPVRVRCSFSASLAVPGCPWLSRVFLACSWLLLAAPGCSWAVPGCSWLLLAASGCSWLSLAVVNVNSRSKENNLFGVLHWDHTSSASSISMVAPTLWNMIVLFGFLLYFFNRNNT